MSHPLCGVIYTLDIPDAQASHVLVITEDLWNQQMGDSAVVPLYELPDAEPSVFRVGVGTKLKAECTRVQSMAHEFISDPVGRCPEEAWLRVRIGVRKFLDIDRRIAMTPAPAPLNPSPSWWPRQNDIHFATNSAVAADDKLYAVISDNDWNSMPGVPNVAAVRLTSKTKNQRLHWEVPVAGGSFVVTGDIYSVAMSTFEQKPPKKKYPSQISDDESAVVAVKQKASLTLS